LDGFEMNISIDYSDPIWLTTRSGFNGSITPDSYTDITQALGGYDSATITMRGSRGNIESWLDKGLGRHIEVFSPSGVKRWEGLVDEISASMGALSITRGPMLNIANKIKVRYSDYTTNVSASTATASNTVSQGLYGTRYKILSAGKCSSATAIRIRDAYLLENAWPESNQTIAKGGDLTLTLTCKGYRYLLDYPYNEATTAAYTLREKLIDVVAGVPTSGIFSANTSQIGANTLSVNQLENTDKLGWDIIKELVAMGGSADNTRAIFGIYNDRVPYYSAIPLSAEYQMRLSDIGINIMSNVGGRVDPWKVVPGKWIEFVDFMAGSVYSATLRQNPRYMFIESVTFTAPSEVSFTGGKTDQLPQRLAKLGLSGI
jgi:hypothetical protein